MKGLNYTVEQGPESESYYQRATLFQNSFSKKLNIIFPKPDCKRALKSFKKYFTIKEIKVHQNGKKWFNGHFKMTNSFLFYM